MNRPWTWTIVWESTVGVGGGMGGGRQKWDEIGTTVIEYQCKKYIFKKRSNCYNIFKKCFARLLSVY